MKATIRGTGRRLLIAYCVISLFLFALFTIASVKAQGTTIALTPPSYTAQEIGEEFSINITIANVHDLWCWKAGIKWDPDVLSPIGGPSEGPFLKSVGATQFLSTPPKNGSIEAISCTLLSDIGASGNGTLATLVFRINNETFLSPITLDDEVLLAPSSGGTHPSIDHQVENATVTLGAQGIRAIAGANQTVNQGTRVTLNASRTLSQGQNLTFTWAFIDRKPVTLEGMIVTYTFNSPRVYHVNLTVSDLEGRSSTDSITITVKDITPPIAIIILQGVSPNQMIEVGQSILFNGSRSYDPENGTIINYAWNLGDGTTYFGSSLSHAYANPGTYNVSLTVTEDGGNTNTATVIITMVKANYPLSLFSDSGVILLAVTAMVLIALPFWIRRTQQLRTNRIKKYLKQAICYRKYRRENCLNDSLSLLLILQLG
jgi:chitodextrinase